VDLGEGRFVNGARELSAAYAASGYVDPARNWTRTIRQARREVALFHQIARRFARLVTQIMQPPPARPPRGLDALFVTGPDQERVARAYVARPWTYWLSPLLDVPVAYALQRSAMRHRHAWRGRTYRRVAPGRFELVLEA
jgi:hypothetical protein